MLKQRTRTYFLFVTGTGTVLLFTIILYVLYSVYSQVNNKYP